MTRISTTHFAGIKTGTTAAVLALAVTGSAPATAGLLGGGPLSAANQSVAYCYFINEGTASVTPSNQQIFEYPSTSVSVATSCKNGSVVSPGQTCYVDTVKALNSVPYSCQLNFSTSSSSVRGAFFIYDGSGNALSSTPLR